MGMPAINITFRELAKTLKTRSDNEIVALVLAGSSNMNPKEYRPGDEIDKGVAADLKTQIQLAMAGGREKPKSVISYFAKAAYEDLDTILDELESVKFDYLTFGSELQEEQKTKVITWVKNMRDQGKKIKAVLADAGAADNKAIINYTTESVTVGETAFTQHTFCSRIAGILAGTPLTMSSTYTRLDDVEQCSKLSKTEMDSKIDAGEFIVFRDGNYIRVARGVNSLQTTSETDPEDFKKIKIVDVIDHIATDISETIKNDWIGQYPNSYDNKCLLVSACQEYLDELVARAILSEAKIEIDVAANKEYLEKKKEDTKDMTDDQLKQANTGEHVFLKATIKILDAMEDFDIEFTI